MKRRGWTGVSNYSKICFNVLLDETSCVIAYCTIMSYSFFVFFLNVTPGFLETVTNSTIIVTERQSGYFHPKKDRDNNTSKSNNVRHSYFKSCHA